MLRRSALGGRTAGRRRAIEGLDKPADGVRENLPTKVPKAVQGFALYRKPPGYVPSSSMQGQVWAIGVDGFWWASISEKVVGWRGERAGSYEDEETGVEPETGGEREG
jgi:hypothetical protein